MISEQQILSSKRRAITVLIAVVACFSTSESFVQRLVPAERQSRRYDSLSPFYDDFEDFSMPKTNTDDDDWFAALRRRQASIKTSSTSTNSNKISEENLGNWKQANCASTVRLSLDDWIRRMAIDTYPLAVCGSASGHLFLADLRQGKELDCLQNVHLARIDEDDSRYAAIEALCGRYDGGGVVALAIKGDLIASSGREGGVHITTIAGQEEDFYKGSRGRTARQTKLSLKPEGFLRGLDATYPNTVMTSLAFDDSGVLWMGGYDGVLRAYDSEQLDSDNRPMMLRQKYPLHERNLQSPILSVSVNDELGCGVGTTQDNGVFLFSLDDGQILTTWTPLFGKRNEFFRTAIIIQNNAGPQSAWSVVIGGSEGSMLQRQLNVDAMTGFVSENSPFLDMAQNNNAELPMKLRPSHMKAVVAMASPAPGLLVTGAQDGNIRVWDCSYFDEDYYDDDYDDDYQDEAQYDDVGMNERRPRCLYAMTGYKVWLGSIFADGKKLASDGADNTIIVHSFDDDEEDVMFREDDDDGEEGGLAFE